MAYFALVQNGFVQQVIVADQEYIDNLPNANEWIETFPDANGDPELRVNYAGIGYIYDQTANVFYPPQPYDGWILNKEIWQWEPPIPYPSDGLYYIWDNQTDNWQLDD